MKRDGAIVDSNGATAGTPPESTTYHYDLLGRMDYTEMPNSVVEDYTFDNMDRLDVMRHYQSDANNADLTDNLLKDMFSSTLSNQFIGREGEAPAEPWNRQFGRSLPLPLFFH